MFKNASPSRKASFDGTRERGPELIGKVGQAIMAFNTRHADQMAAAKQKIEAK